MSEDFEPVLSIHDYYDGPRVGVANFQGVPHRFRSLGWLPDGGFDEGYDYDPVDDRFFLSPLDAPPDYPEFVVRGQFRVQQPVPDLPPGVVRPLEVRWIPGPPDSRLTHP